MPNCSSSRRAGFPARSTLHRSDGITVCGNQPMNPGKKTTRTRFFSKPGCTQEFPCSFLFMFLRHLVTCSIPAAQTRSSAGPACHGSESGKKRFIAVLSGMDSGRDSVAGSLVERSEPFSLSPPLPRWEEGASQAAPGVVRTARLRGVHASPIENRRDNRLGNRRHAPPSVRHFSSRPPQPPIRARGNRPLPFDDPVDATRNGPRGLIFK